ncbi:MAG TPA: sugar ABC transporter substrate-binding protein [Thermodesulfobacteriota bacterium]
MKAVVAVVLALLVAGPAHAAEVVRFLHNETDPPSIEFFNRAIKQFEAEHPGIRVEMEAVSTDGRLQKVTAAMNARTMPEVFKILPEERFNFGRRGFLVPLDDVAREIGLSDFPEELIIRIDGKIYDLPYTLGNFSTLWYRADLLEAKGVAVPKTWDEWLAAARALTDGDTYGTVFPAGKNRMTSLFFSSLFWSAGGTYFDKNLEVTFDKGDAAVKALAFLKELARYAPPGIASYSYNDMINTYLTGKIALDLYAPRLIANAASNRPDLVGKTRAAPPPAGPSGVGVRFVNQNSFAIASERVGAGNVEAAKTFLKYILTGDRAAEFSLTAYPHLIPPLASVRNHPLVRQGTPALKDRPDFAKMAYDTSNSLDFENEAGARIVDGKVVPGVANPYIGSIVARDIPALVVQRVVLQGQDPAEAVRWGAAEMRRIVNDLRKRQ